MLWFTVFLSEDLSLFAFVIFIVVGAVLLRNAVLLRTVLLAALFVGLGAWFVLLVSGLFSAAEESIRIVHGAAGHLMLPIASSATGLYLGSTFARRIRRPLRLLPRLLFLLLLCFLCFSNTRTGYLGPLRVDSAIYPATSIRFDLVHRAVFP